MKKEKALRAELDKILSGKGAHASFDEAVKGLPAKLRGVKPEQAPHSAWELLEHMRIAQRDMLEFCRNPKHKSPKWPEGYWPKSAEPPSGKAWSESVAEFRKDLKAMRKLVADKDSDLYASFAHGDGQTLLREALQLADHNAYHVGELVFLRRVLDCWGK
jgi:hypothetical protein